MKSKMISVINLHACGRSRQFLIVLFIVFNSAPVMAQEDEDSFLEKFAINVNVKNMHTWHGFVVTPGAMVAGSMDVGLFREKFRLGIWGGSSFNGEYTELSYYLNYRLGPKSILSLVSHNNYSGLENPNIFSWNKYHSTNFLDIVVETSVSQYFPLNIYFSTILLGQGGDYEIDVEGRIEDSYSNYLEVRYPVFDNNKLRPSLFAGGAFSFFTEKTFYSEQANMVSLGFQAERILSILNYSRTLKAKAFWNPESKRAVLELDFSLL
ncbi:hypothetical protein SAMN05444483_1137 [Salegentibacter echinorum]|uniref:Outer membrane protein beta-barrel domain-containing protein n=1 Tax=Salegentibacter echinorum TaxID=1073325 RepID=A0A1M5K0W9_SALEC|nr:hypothetical protein [Salegentibacter echinorum]SHG46421.1 hypothetical protein SAMN05444483_1137 [Salegentibacter echinorum]